MNDKIAAVCMNLQKAATSMAVLRVTELRHHANAGRLEANVTLANKRRLG